MTAAALCSCAREEGAQSCKTYVRDELEFEPQTPGGSVQGQREYFPITNERFPPERACTGELSIPQPECGSPEPSPSTAMSLYLICTLVGGARPGFRTTLGDIRELEVGDYPLEARTLYTDHARYDVTLHVDASTGHGGEYPSFVTSDFTKTLSVEFHSDFINGSLELDIRADQFVAKPRQKCTMCYL